MSERTGGGRRTLSWAVVSAFALFVVLGAVTAALGAALPALRREFALPDSGGGIAVGAYNAGALVATLVCGFGERVLPGVRRTFVGGLVLFAAGALVAATASAWPGFLVGVAVAGAGYGVVVLLLNTEFAAGFGERSVLMINLLNALFGLGAMLGPLGVAVAGAAGARPVLLLAAVLALPGVAALSCLTDRPSPAPGASGGAPGRSALRGAAPFVLVGFLYAGLETAVGAWESTHLTWTGRTVATAAVLTAVFWGAHAVGRVVLPLLVRRPRHALLVRGGLAVTVLALGSAVLPSLAPTGYTLAGLALAPVLPTLLAWLAVAQPAAHRLATSVLLTATMVANAAVPAAVGGVVTRDEPASIPVVLVALAVAALLASLLPAGVGSRARGHTGALRASGDYPST